MAAITYRETNNFTAAELETLRGLGLGPVPGAAEAGHGAFQPGHFRLGRGQAYRPGAGAGRRGDGGLSPLPAGGPGYQGQHIGQELMERILEKHKHMLHVKIMPSDPKTIPFYERFGFVAGGSYTAMELNQMQ